MRDWLACVAVVACLLLSACAAPVPDYDAYRAAAANTISAIVSALASAQLAVQVDLRGRAFAAFTNDNVTNAENDADSISSTFGSRQPPDSRSEALQRQMSQALSQATNALTDLRIAVRLGNSQQVIQALAVVMQTLRLFQRLQQGLQ